MSAPSSASDFARFVDIVAPGRNDVVAVIEAYFDESYDDSLLCVAGYAFRKTKAKALDREWRHLLRRNKKLPYFRMSACAHHNDPFDRLTISECDQVARDAISLIRNYASLGVAVTVDEKAFESLVPAKVQAEFGGAYEFCAWNCIMGVTRWLNEILHSKAKVAYIFEAGHKHQGKTSALFDRLFHDSELREEHHYQSHAFILKEACRPCQAADVLAWQWFEDRKRETTSKPRRKDCAALLRDRLYITRHIDLTKHLEVVSQLQREYPLRVSRGKPS